MNAEKMNIKIIHPDQKNPYLLSPDEERNVLSKQRANRSQLTVPRRPKWDQSTTPAELDRLEKESFLHWRRSLAELQENKDLLMTPFERNLEMWRQLWRVIERSDLIVQIVDARNPLLFRCEDLENYVKEVDSRKKTLLLINKADMMTDKQRTVWADYFEKEGIAYTFFSAALAKEQLEEALIEEEDGEYEDLEEDDEEITEEELNAAAKSLDLEDDGEEDSEDDDEGGVVVPREAVAQGTEQAEKVAEGTSKAEGQDKSIQEVKELDDHNQMRIRILTADELEELFLSEAPEIERALIFPLQGFQYVPY